MGESWADLSQMQGSDLLLIQTNSIFTVDGHLKNKAILHSLPNISSWRGA